MSTTKLILVIGATGAQGLAVIDALLAPATNGSPSPYAVRALTRNPAGQRALELRARGSFEDQEAVSKALNGVYGVYVNTDGFTVGEIREIYAGMLIFEAAKKTKSLRHYVWSSVPYASKLAGFKPQYRAGHMNGKALVADWLRGQPSTPSNDGLAWTILETVIYTEMLACGLLEPLNIRADGTVVFAVPTGDGKFPLVTLKDIGWWTRYTFDHRAETSGQDLAIASHVVGMDEIAKTFTKVTGKPAVYKPQTLEEWWNNFGPQVNSFIGSGSMTIKQNFSGFWNTFGGELVPRDMDWIRSVHPGTQSLEDWMRETNYTGGGSTILKSREDYGSWGLKEDVTRKL
ncbi:NmrA domain-containing protein [Mycena sanguinolenta]|uniref:NmrA domain-containing protein n=1 Tax=Mycena sanguinolenta TaxID=230812 RepID=A0A8H6ZCS4_9AGAR|nr:NmrA domain-containing protein [Mycena sanguinolenta]